MKIAIIAHDGKKAEMVQFLLDNKEALKKVELVATGPVQDHEGNAGLAGRANTGVSHYCR